MKEIILFCVVVLILAGCQTTETTTTATTDTGSVTSTTTSYTIDTEQLSALVGVAGEVANLVAAVSASTTPSVADDSAIDQVANAALGYVMTYLQGAKVPVQMPQRAVDTATTRIAMMAFQENGAFPRPEEIAAYVVTGTEPTEAELIAYCRTGLLTKAK